MREYFLGSMTGAGFKTDFYDEFDNYYGYFLKGGPGTGKSTLMKKLAALFEGEKKSVYYCSSDPVSLDAVVFEDRKIFVVDATAPHTGDTRLPFVTGEIVNLADSLELKKITKNKDKLNDVTDKNLACHMTVKRYISCVEELQKQLMDIGKKSFRTNKSPIYEFKPLTKNYSHTGSRLLRQSVALTPKGKIAKWPREFKVTALNDDCLYSAMKALSQIEKNAIECGYDVERCELGFGAVYAIIIPKMEMIYCIENLLPDDVKNRVEIAVDMNECYEASVIEESKDFILYANTLIKDIEEKITNKLKEALRIHDSMESFFIDALDREWLNRKFLEIKGKIEEI